MPKLSLGGQRIKLHFKQNQVESQNEPKLATVT